MKPRSPGARPASRIRVVVLGALFATAWAAAHSPHDDVFDVAVSPDFLVDETAFAIVRSNLMRTRDGGKSWHRMTRGLDFVHTPVQMAVAPDARTLYVATLGDGIFRSTDAGETWARANAGIDTGALDGIAVSPRRSGFALAAGVESGLFVTRDGGAAWQTLDGPFGKVTAIAFDAHADDELWIGDHRGGIYRSVDAAANWTTAFKAEDAVTDIVVTPASDGLPELLFGTAAGNLYRLAAGTGEFLASKSAGAGSPIVAIRLSPDFASDGKIMATSWKEGVHCSSDRGATWQTCANGLTTDRQAATMGRPSFSGLSLAPGFSRNGVAFVAGFDGLFLTRDHGERWEELDSLSPLNVVGLAVSPDFAADRSLLMTNGMWGAYRSTDGGLSWAAVNDGVRDQRRSNGLTCLFSVVFSPDFANDRTIFTSTWWRLLKTENRGDSWRQIVPMERPEWTETHHGASLAVSPSFAADGTLYLASHRGLLLRSSDRGNSFDIVTDFERFIGSVALLSRFEQDDTVFIGDTHGVHRSGDGGRSWTFTSLVDARFHADIPVSPAYPADEAAGWLDDLRLNRNKEIAVDVVAAPAGPGPGTVFAGTPNGLYVSTDGGRTWQITGGNVPADAHIESLAISPDFANDGTVVVSVLGKGHFRSADGGERFVEIATALTESQELLANYAGVMPRFPAIAFSPDYARDRTLFGFSGPRLYASRDAGDTWQALAAPQPEVLDRSGVWYRSQSKRRKAAYASGLVTLALLAAVPLYLRRRSRR